MFKNEKGENSSTIKDVETVIGHSVKVKGNFHGEGNMVIEGVVEGSIKTSNNLLVGDKAKIKADIQAGESKIGGEITGNIIINGYLEVISSAKITGDIHAKSFSVEKGAIINGKVSMGELKINEKSAQ